MKKSEENINQPSILMIAVWCLYDWACSSFSVIVTTFVFSTYFTTKVAANEILGTYQWANATSLAGFFIALTSPLFGAIADHGGYHKYWLLFFTTIAIIATGLLWFAYPSVNAIFFTLMCVVIGTIGYEVAQVFYNAFLPLLAPKNYLGRISGWGWGCGYFGGIIALSLALIIIKTNLFSLNTETSAQVRIIGPFVALWYALFALPIFFCLPPLSSVAKPLTQAIREGSKELISTLKKLPHEKNMLLFLFSHMIYADGLNTLFAFGGIYAAGTYGLSFEEVLVFGITMNITAGLGAFVLGFIDDWLGSKLTVIFSLCGLILFGIPILFLHDKYIFWAFALALCLFVGPAQSASRSMMVRLIAEKNMSTEMFGLYALSGKITAFIGPWILGFMTMTFVSQRVGMATVLVFFAIGGLLLLPVKVDSSSG